MFRHCVLFRWTDEASDDQKQAVRDGLAALPTLIPEIRRYRFGDDAGLAEGNFDFAVVADFDSADAWRTYAAHAEHQRLIAERVRPILAGRAAVQFALGEEQQG